MRFDLVLHAARADTSNWPRDVNGGPELHTSAVGNVQESALPLSTRMKLVFYFRGGS
jgi:hypothetical protein